MQPISRNFRFGLLFMLVMTESIPLALLWTAMPVLLRRSGASLKEIGALSLVMFPWALKALWAPLIDKVGARSRFGRYRGWLFVTHPLLLLTFLAGAFVDIPTLLISHRLVGAVALLWLSLVSATADTASHGLAVKLLSGDERGMGNGVQNAGIMMGHLIGGGMTVVVVGILGWRPALLILAGLVLLPLLGVALYREPPVAAPHSITLREMLTFFRRRHVIRWLVVLAAVWMLPAIPGVPFQTLFVDRGLGLTEIGLMVGIVGNGAGAIGGALGGLYVLRRGRQRGFFDLNLASIACLGIASLLITREHPNRPMLYGAVIAAYFGMAVGATILYTMMMDRSRDHVASTDYTIQYSLMQFCAFWGTSLGGILAGAVGGNTLFVAVPLLMLSVLAIAARILDHNDFQAEPE